MNILLDPLPSSLEIGGREYDIHWDFRTSILFSILMQDPEVPETQKLTYALQLYYPVIPDNVQEAIEQILRFYRCGKEDASIPAAKAGKEAASAEWIYSFEHDDLYIYAAFMEQYHMDLCEASLHWWQFKAMFEALSENTLFKKIMQYRAVKIDSKMTKEEQKFYRQMKQEYALPKNISKAEEQKINEIEEALLRDGNIENLLR